MRWITREKAKVDRIACPWLISRFIDPEGEFFVPKDQVLVKGKEFGAVPFYVQGCELTYFVENGTEYVSFDPIIRKYGLDDPALLELAKIMRSADPAQPNPEKKRFGLKVLAEGFRMISKNYYENMKLQFPAYDALYAYCRSKINNSGKTRMLIQIF
ncbi:TVG1258953 [Thermoplasma volcanium GSS1]|uniref:TVG1258953 protein n=1 Tax=Thermoplasma volcanium (strain ATCC 51530 / DSM 4299 / JCM 9571 / NBRC 15438 / GSS1) TaxID=273116 RepID=Q979D8_THEVO|nr:chromate resistance protein ChrB domain-containing protein [Thermoplasma volcanium]BAB60365.1 TVG1258953 [Thermoplasma volcanium GSS1]